MASLLLSLPAMPTSMTTGNIKHCQKYRIRVGHFVSEAGSKSSGFSLPLFGNRVFRYYQLEFAAYFFSKGRSPFFIRRAILPVIGQDQRTPRLCTKRLRAHRRQEYFSLKGAKAQRRKENLRKRGSALRLCAFAREISSARNTFCAKRDPEERVIVQSSSFGLRSLLPGATS